jgi:hypothetical protein
VFGPNVAKYRQTMILKARLSTQSILIASIGVLVVAGGCNWRDGAKSMGSSAMNPPPDGFMLPAERESGLDRTGSSVIATDDEVRVLLGTWTALIALPDRATDAARQMLQQQEQIAAQYEGVSLILKEDDLYEMSLFGVKITGRYQVISGFAELTPETIMGLTFAEAAKKPPNGPDKRPLTNYADFEGRMNLEYDREKERLIYERTPSETRFIFTRKAGTAPVPTGAVPGSVTPNPEPTSQPGQPKESDLTGKQAPILPESGTSLPSAPTPRTTP